MGSINREPQFILDDDEAARWYRRTPKWVLAQALQQFAASASEAGCDLGLDGKRADGWLPLAKRECLIQLGCKMDQPCPDPS